MRKRIGNLHTSVPQLIRSACLALVALLFEACTAIPISSMYSLSKIEPLQTNPEHIRVAIRVNESVNATHGSAQIIIGYKAEDGSIDEEYEFDVRLTSAQTLTPKLTRGMLPGERVTVMSLLPQDARIMKDIQQRVYKYDAAGGDGDGIFSLRLRKLCLDKKLPDGDIPLTMFLRTESHEDYIVFVRYELHDLFSDTNSDIDSLPFCEDMLAEEVW